MLWRRQNTFTKRTLDLIGEWAHAIGDNAVLETLIAIATEPDNRFNADYLDQHLRALPMPERDVQWSTRATLLIEEGEEPVNTLIDWVLTNGLEQIEPTRARLAAIALAWLTSLSHRWARDMATKALATLLVDRRELAAALIGQFANVDDTYVVDRVLAAAYGAATRRSGDEGLAELARAAFAAVFARNPLPTHALIRDHARGIVELAASRGVLPADVPINRARPPYPTGMPLEIIDQETLGTYVQDYNGHLFRDEIRSSAVEDGDFARYEIDLLARQFLRLPRQEFGRSMREIYEAWHAKAVAPHIARVAALEHAIELAGRAHSRPLDFDSGKRRFDAEEQKQRRLVEEEREVAIVEFERLLDETEVDEFRIRAAGYLRRRMWDESATAWHPTYEGERSRHWVAWRAHELGWTPERFAKFDRQMASRGRMEHRIERIGKKYQWIALHELTGRLSDISLVGSRFQDDHELYRGPWQVGTREMDPTILVTQTQQRDSNRQDATWWSPHAPRWRDDPPEARVAWMEDQLRDIPDPVQQIDTIDPGGNRWLVLDTSVGRNQLVMVDGERVIQRMTWHKVKSVLVARDDVERLEQLLISSAGDRDHPPAVDMTQDGYLGEYPWHPAFSSIEASWKVGTSAAISTQATVAGRYVERSGHDYSIEESINLTIPAPALMHGLHLRLAEGRSLAYATADGNVLFKDPSVDEPGFSAAIVDRDAIRTFLDAEGQEIVWIFTGEKSAHGGRSHRNGWGGMLQYWGIYRFVGDSLQGRLSFKRQDATPEQLKELLASR